jgi:putative transposase
MMQAVGRSYVRWFNKIYQRTGTLWEGRYRSTLLQPDPYLLLCMVYLDNHPLRNQVVEKLSDYPWSSYHHYTGQRNDHRITPHAIVWGLGNTPFAREATYTELVQKGLATELQKTLRDTVLHGWILGDAAFKNFLQTQTQRRLSKAKPGRPRTPKNAAS